ncbi:MAG TPA: hypothetical protein VHB98_05225 [Chloroflexota bacterium]|jgi:hypothetical protein|nr:hypothetical protein [Chloroflexota bacterium]
MLRPIIWLALLSVCINGILSTAHARAATPQAVNLRLADMPTGFKQTRESMLDDDAAAALDPATSVAGLKSEGQLLENEVRFRQVGAQTGVLAVDATVVQFTNEHAAGARFSRSTADTRRYVLANRLAALQPLRVASVGTKYAGWANHPSKGDTQLQVIVEFYRQRFDVTVALDERTTHADTQQLVRLARLVDRRILQSH